MEVIGAAHVTVGLGPLIRQYGGWTEGPLPVHAGPVDTAAWTSVVAAAAGITGAAVGGGCAILASRLQTQALHRQWRRQGQRDEYATFIAAATALIHELWSFEGECERGEVWGFEMSEKHQLLRSLSLNLLARVHHIGLEGPHGVIRATYEVVDALDRVLDGVIDIAEHVGDQKWCMHPRHGRGRWMPSWNQWTR
ncbi:hypothetical protein [Streptomyces sp. CRN 30]|uniref:hypothetical protein n=1 Tax=Streptomyces sp. CRN 30 TaxID=3075613 RepID=UPI002A819726|nr:hypothetical protein [Streptomyces sp. CRN 30]